MSSPTPAETPNVLHHSTTHSMSEPTPLQTPEPQGEAGADLHEQARAARPRTVWPSCRREHL